uniref:Uncharacterized protein n=1 Tax=Spironucleus salmonicida TaxID=348837 RepID=V6LUR6_9EUKA|eukprot:EST48372.1 Hypothetical protein SS50377_11446 [Spironucleus salmonicida]
MLITVTFNKEMWSMRKNMTQLACTGQQQNTAPVIGSMVIGAKPANQNKIAVQIVHVMNQKMGI